ncbi:hypothetical protein [Jiangella alkaliphila]|uniref:Uncharacterized protein n=1 Tax=Jiangella alkaliphila TaxID=419479 RepID=A0A1H2KAT6_9ACTN|nr:hypothetical protein [Jiangella alkaliphila]SDU65683.1 hypothetical protein SAMN04488563_3610 [Jiangella alkaliphila]
MHIDCDRCEMRGLACSDCVVSVLLGPIDSELGGEERQALGVLAEAGLVPPLRLVVTEGDGAARNSAETPARDLREAREAG